MPRRPRTVSEGDTYHVVSRGVAKMTLFHDFADHERFLECIDDTLRKHGGEIYAWCLMANHIHLVLHMPLEGISKFMHDVKSSYALYYNKRYQRVGHVFQGRFHSEAINDDEYLLTAIRYVHQNPLKAGICKTDESPWSSYSEYLGVPRLCNTAFVLELFGGLDQFKHFHAVRGDEAHFEFDASNETRIVDICRSVCWIYGIDDVHDVGALPKRRRDEALSLMKERGMSVRDISRKTGVSTATVSRA